MIQAKGYVAQNSETGLALWNFERRKVGPHDVQINIAYCGVCHTYLHQIRDNWIPRIFSTVPGHEIVCKIVKVDTHMKKIQNRRSG
jgi:alcohol dehydrogenase (NADP+)